MSKPKKIGKVKLSWLDSADMNSEKYSDGNAEEQLLDIFTAKDPKEKINNTLSNEPSWPLYYHLSPLRRNVVDWYNFKKNAKVLEIGAGCGAITEALVSKDIRVTSLELTARRAKINALRNKDSNNLEIIVGNLDEYETIEKFDYIVCVGVLEYAGSFIQGNNPYEKFLIKIKEMLKSDGKLILAIENRLGLKYMAGAREDHTGGFFDGLNQYPTGKKVQTFGRKELSDLLGSSGLSYQDFRYPYPDYKHPQFIYSDLYFPSKDISFPLGSLPAPALDQQRFILFSESLAMLSIEKNGLYPDFSNSFIVVASAKELDNNQNVFFQSQPKRKEKYWVKTEIHYTDSKFIVKKIACGNKSIKHVNEISNTYHHLDKKTSDYFSEAKLTEDGSVEIKYIHGKVFERQLFEHIITNDEQSALDLIHKYVDLIDRVANNKQEEYTHNAIIDLNFDNIVIDSNHKLNIIDYEWLSTKSLSYKLIKQRAFIIFLIRYSKTLLTLANRIDLVELYEGLFCPKYLVKFFDFNQTDIDDLNSFENLFQKNVLKYHEPSMKINKVEEIVKVQAPLSILDEAAITLPKAQRDIDSLHDQLQKMLQRAETAEKDAQRINKEYDSLKRRTLSYNIKRLSSKLNNKSSR